MRDLSIYPLSDYEIIRVCLNCSERFVADGRIEYHNLGFCSLDCEHGEEKYVK